MRPYTRRWILAVLSVATIICWATWIDQRLANEAERAIARSDQAFNEGHLHRALEEALRVSSSAPLSAPLIRRAAERLRAIAVGSEATGRRNSALLAWLGLSMTSRECCQSSAHIAQWGQQAEQHVESLLSKGIDVQGNGIQPVTRVAVTTSGEVQAAGARHMLGYLVVIVLSAIGISARHWFASTRFQRVLSSKYTLGALLVSAAASWCLAWTIR